MILWTKWFGSKFEQDTTVTFTKIKNADCLQTVETVFLTEAHLGTWSVVNFLEQKRKQHIMRLKALIIWRQNNPYTTFTSDILKPVQHLKFDNICISPPSKENPKTNQLLALSQECIKFILPLLHILF